MPVCPDSGTIIIVPRSAGASSPTLPQSVIIKLIKASGKSVRYRDSLAFPCCTYFDVFGSLKTLTVLCLHSDCDLVLLRYNPFVLLPRRPHLPTYRKIRTGRHRCWPLRFRASRNPFTWRRFCSGRSCGREEGRRSACRANLDGRSLTGCTLKGDYTLAEAFKWRIMWRDWILLRCMLSHSEYTVVNA